MVESEMGMIPKGWRAGQLSDLIEVKYGKDNKKLEEGDIPVYGSGGVMRFVNKALYSGESVLIPRKGSLNNVMYVNGAFWSVDTMFYTIMKYENLVKFIYFFIVDKDLMAMNAGSAVPSMTTDILNKMAIKIPSKKILYKFENTIGNMFKLLKENKCENDRLISIRDILLPKLMSGEIRVNDIKLDI